MMNRYTTILAVAASLTLASQVAMAQQKPSPAAATPVAGPQVPEANLPEQCQKLMRSGFTIKHQTITRGGTAATNPRPGSNAHPRKYGEAGNDKWFIDSFPEHPKDGCRICGVTVAVKGTVNAGSMNNDSITVIGSNTTGPQYAANWSLNQTNLGSKALKVEGSYSELISISGTAWMSWYMASLHPSLDVAVQDDSSVAQIEVTYYYY